MARRRLDLTAKQITAICRGAKDAGFIAEIKIGEVYIRLVPEEYSAHYPYDEKVHGYL